MKLTSRIVAIAAAASLAATPVWADRGGGHGHGHGGGWGWGPFGVLLGSALLISALEPRPYYPPPVVYAPPVYYPAPAVAAPVVATAPVAPAESAQWWYFCRSAKAFYPYVRDCPGGWERVSPAPPEAARR